MLKVKFRVVSIAQSESFEGQRVELKPISESDNASQNSVLSEDSSRGLIELYIADSAAVRFFYPGKRCLVTFTSD